MGLFDFFKKPKSDVEMYHEQRKKTEEQEHMAEWQKSAEQGPFRMRIQDVFSIKGRGTVVVGEIESGSIAVGDVVALCRKNNSRVDVKIDGIEAFRKMLNTAHAGDKVGILLNGVSKNDICAGDIIEK